MLFTLSETLQDCFFRIIRKMFVLYDKVMQIVSKEIGADSSTMTIKDSKEANLWPFYFNIRFILWFHDIQYNADSIFIVFSNDTLISIGCICFNYSTFLH